MALSGYFGLASSAFGQEPPTPGDPRTVRPNRPDASTSVSSGPNGVTVRITVEDFTPGNGGGSGPSSTGSSTSTAETWDCRVDLMNIGNASRGWFESEAPQHPGQSPWFVNCTNGYASVVWLPNSTDSSDVTVEVDTGAPTVDPLLLAAELLDEIPVPDIEIGTNPSTGLVAVPSWFWLVGYDGAPIIDSTALAGVIVEVEITPTSFYWSFGDGKTLETSSIGRAYPAASDIQHTYGQSSLRVGGSYSVDVEVTFAVRYRVDGGAWEDLEPISRSFTSQYPVQQLQSVLTDE